MWPDILAYIFTHFFQKNLEKVLVVQKKVVILPRN